ncbi:MAG: class II aldolase/adducin family protein [Anaeromyxobacter sp.]
MQNAREQIVASARRLSARGLLVATGGNLSVRIPGQAAFAITPSDLDYGLMQPEDVCVLGLDLAPLDARRKPSIEASLHAAVYRARPDAGAVVHTHQPYASAVALLGLPIPALFDEQVRFLGRQVEVVPYRPSGTGMLRSALEKRLASRANAYILANHGAVCIGPDLGRAETNVELLEKCAMAFVLALCTERKVSKIPLVVREIAFSRLKADQAAAALGAAALEKKP